MKIIFNFTTSVKIFDLFIITYNHRRFRLSPTFLEYEKKSLQVGTQIVDKLDENINWAIPDWYFHFLFA